MKTFKNHLITEGIINGNINLDDNNVVTVYHRTGKGGSREMDFNLAVTGSICGFGFKTGSGAMYGPGIYANYSMESMMGKNNFGLETYGPYVVRAKINISNFLIFDREIAKSVYGKNYRLYDQIESNIGWETFTSPQHLEENKRFFKAMDKRLDTTKRFTSNVALEVSNRYHLANTGLAGILFTGHNDGNTVVLYKEYMAQPEDHAFVDGRYQHNPGAIVWEPCPPRDKAALEELNLSREEQLKLKSERNRLLDSLIKAKANPRTFKIRRENYPTMPDALFNDMVLSYFYEDEKRLEYIPEDIKDDLQKTLEVGILLKKIKHNPMLYLKDYESADEEIKEAVPPTMLADAFQEYVDKNPQNWEDIPEDIRNGLNPSEVINYHKAKIAVNDKNILYVPEALLQVIKDEARVSEDTLNNYTKYKEGLTDIDRETNEYTVPTTSVSWLKGKIEKLNNKATRLGLPGIKLEIVAEDRASFTTDLRLTTSVPIIKGWKVVAKVTITRDPITKEEVRTIERLGSEEMPEDYIENKLTCHHCGHERQRNEYYIIKNTEDGKYMCVGSSCLTKFIGDFSLDPEKIAKFAQTIHNFIITFKEQYTGGKKTGDQLRKSFKRNGIPLPFYISRVMRSINKNGYVSRKTAVGNQLTTAQDAWQMSMDEKYDQQTYEELPKKDIVFMDNAIEWVLSIDDPDKVSDFIWTMHIYAVPGVVKKQTYALLAYLPEAYSKHLESIERPNGQYIDGIGSLVYFKGQIITKKPLFFQLQSGNTISYDHYYYSANNGEHTVAWGSYDDMGLEKGDEVYLKGVVSNLTVSEDGYITNLDSVEVIDENEYTTNAREQEQRTQAFGAEKQATKVEYNNGETINNDFVVTDVKPTRRPGSFMYRLKDEFGTSVSMFLTKDKATLQKGQEVNLTGVVKHNSWQGRTYINLDPVTEIDGTPLAAPAPVQKKTYTNGENIEEDFTVMDRRETAGYAYNSPSQYNYKLKDDYGTTISMFRDSTKDNYEVGDRIRIKAKIKIKGPYTNLTYAKILKRYDESQDFDKLVNWLLIS